MLRNGDWKLILKDGIVKKRKEVVFLQALPTLMILEMLLLLFTLC